MDLSISFSNARYLALKLKFCFFFKLVLSELQVKKIFSPVTLNRKVSHAIGNYTKALDLLCLIIFSTDKL